MSRGPCAVCAVWCSVYCGLNSSKRCVWVGLAWDLHTKGCGEAVGATKGTRKCPGLNCKLPEQLRQVGSIGCDGVCNRDNCDYTEALGL